MNVDRKVKLAVVTHGYVIPSQTFINRHIRELFDGNSVVVHERSIEADPSGKTRFCLHDHGFVPSDTVELISGSLRNMREFGSMRPPVGRARIALERFLVTEGVSAILVELAQYAPMILPTAKALNIPLFIYFRGYDATGYLRPPLRKARRLRAYRAVFDQAAGIFSVSRSLLESLAGHGLRHPNSHVVPSGVDTARFLPGSKDPGLVVSVGRFVPKKAPEITIRAFLQAAEGLDHARLEMIGEGPLLRKARRLADQLDIEGKIRFLGAQPHEKVREKLARADIFVQHSVRAPNGDEEGAPTAIQEAMACGAAIVATRHAGIPDLVAEGRNGLLADEFDLAGYSAQLRRLLCEPEVARRFGEDARRFAEQELDVGKLYARVEAVISQAVHSRAGPEDPS